MLKLKRLVLSVILMPVLFRSSLFAVGDQKNEVEKLSLKKGRATYVDNFAEDVKRYYCDAHWVCRAFEMMSLVEFLGAWRQVAALINHECVRWNYAHDSKDVYEDRLTASYVMLDRYNRESLDVDWLRECQVYHTFLNEYVVDNERGVIIKKDKAESFKIVYEKRYTIVSYFLALNAPKALLEFYGFFFEQVSNIILKKLNYLYEASEIGSVDGIVQLIRHRNLLTEIYQICTRRLVGASPQYARKMSYHYNRLESVIDFVVSDVLKRVGLA